MLQLLLLNLYSHLPGRQPCSDITHGEISSPHGFEVRLLLKARADMEAVDSRGLTALKVAEASESWVQAELAGNEPISHQTGKPENHQLKNDDWEGICDRSQEGVHIAYYEQNISCSDSVTIIYCTYKPLFVFCRSPCSSINARKAPPFGKLKNKRFGPLFFS